MSEQTKPQQFNQNQNQNQPKKQDETRKHSPNQGPDYDAPGRTDGTERKDQKIQAPQK